MRRIVLASVVALIASVSARAEPNTPDIADAALAYRGFLELNAKEATVPSLLAGIKRAENERNLPEVVRLYEQLAGHESNNFRTWLKLGLAWKDVDNSAVEGTNAGWNAYRLAQTAPDRVDALLLMTSVLRNQLIATRESYDASYERLAQINRNLNDMVGSAACAAESSPSTGDTNRDATNGLALLCANREQVSNQAERDTARLGTIASDLDEMYADLATKFPGLDVKRLQDLDKREKEFAPASFVDQGPEFSYKFVNGITRSCVEFTQELNSNAALYADKVAAEVQQPEGQPANSEPPKWSLSVEGPRLCFDNLGAGLTYRIVLRKGLPSKLGATLAQDLERDDLDVPNFPAQIRFSGGRFIMPKTGGGTIDIHATNLQSLDLELFRVSDRTLYRQIALGFIGGIQDGADTLPADQYDDLNDHFGELLWRGTLTMPKRWKPNQSVGAEVRARDLLNQRKEWLNARLPGGVREGVGNRLNSEIRTLSTATEDEAGLSGKFFADGSEFEAATQGLDSPGVYALVAQPVDRSGCAKNSDAQQDNEPAGTCNRAVQWFVITDVGITFYEGLDNFDVVLRSLETGEAVRGKVQLVTSGNRVLGEVETNEFGVATFPRSLTRGTQSNALAAVMAQTSADFAFLIFGAERLDLSKLNVDGRTLPLGLDAFLTTDRGIYEPGQSIELFVLLRDREGRSIDPPVESTVRLEERGRVLDKWTRKPEAWTAGGLHIPLMVPKDARPGPVRIVLSLGDNDALEIGQTVVHIGAIVPDRVEVQFPQANTAWSARAIDGKLEVGGPISARYLFASDFGPLRKIGAARDLRVEATVHISAGETPRDACYDGYVFGRYDEKPIPTTSQTFTSFTDADGNATLSLRQIDLPVATRPAAAAVDVTVYDASGALGARSLALAITDGKGWLGLPKAPRLHQDLKTGRTSLDLDVVRIAPNFSREAESTLEVSLARQRELL